MKSITRTRFLVCSLVFVFQFEVSALADRPSGERPERHDNPSAPRRPGRGGARGGGNNPGRHERGRLEPRAPVETTSNYGLAEGTDGQTYCYPADDNGDVQEGSSPVDPSDCGAEAVEQAPPRDTSKICARVARGHADVQMFCEGTNSSDAVIIACGSIAKGQADIMMFCLDSTESTAKIYSCGKRAQGNVGILNLCLAE